MSNDRDKREKELTMAILFILIAMQDMFDLDGRGGSWPEFENKIVSELQPRLADAYRDSAVALATSQKVAEPAIYGDGAEEWASVRAREVAAEMRANTEKRVDAARMRSTSPETFGDELSGIFNQARASKVAVTEVTVAFTAGERGAADMMADKAETLIVPYWKTEQDSKVCPVCRALHGLPEEDWPAPLADGPPAHPNCRCELDWRPSQNSSSKSAA